MSIGSKFQDKKFWKSVSQQLNVFNTNEVYILKRSKW